MPVDVEINPFFNPHDTWLTAKSFNSEEIIALVTGGRNGDTIRGQNEETQCNGRVGSQQRQSPVLGPHHVMIISIPGVANFNPHTTSLENMEALTNTDNQTLRLNM